MGVMNFVQLDSAVKNAFYALVDYCYNSVDALFAYDFMGHLLRTTSWLKDNDFMVLYELLLYTVEPIVQFELIMSKLFDTLIQDYGVYFTISESTVRKYLASLDPTLFAIYHPEFGHMCYTNHSSYFEQFIIDIKFGIQDVLITYSLVEPLSFFAQICALFYFLFFFISFFFSFFTSDLQEEGAVDMEFSVTNLTIEAEKELFAVEDAKYAVIIFIAFFSTYFGISLCVLGPTWNAAFFFFGLVPLTLFLVFGMPCNLLYDFGLLMSLYLRGASNTKYYFFELIYDYIGIIAFFTRLIVQFVRIGLIFVVYCMMHDTVVLQGISYHFIPVGDSFLGEIAAMSFNAHSISYYLVTVLPHRLLYWGYEVVHTFFVATAQFAAFFTIAFWLYLLFYTFYTFEKFEFHFKNLRNIQKRMFEELAILNNK